MFDEPDPRFYAAPSTIPGAGRGLFARVPLRAGDRLTVIGVLVRRDSAFDHYTEFVDEYKFRAGDYLLIPFGVASMANHSSQPNIKKVVEGEAVFLEVLRDVDAGEEVQRVRARALRHRLMSDTTALQRPVVVETDPSSSFVCDYVAGINRVLSLPPYLLVDNIGRNFEMWQFQTGHLEPAMRARYDLTSYPDDPMASLLDVDLHAAFLRRHGRELLAVNHYGRVRGFELPASTVRMKPAWEVQLLGDTERIVMAGDSFIASSPRGEFTDDPSRPGIFLFEPLAAPPWPESGEARRLACDQALAGWGVITGLAVSAAANRLAVAAGPRLGIFDLERSTAGIRLGDCLWEASLRFHCQWLHLDEAERLWTGGYRPSSSAANDNWDACCGGGIDVFAAESGAHYLSAALPEETAWGYGADPIVLTAGCRELYVLGRDASLYVIDATTGASHRLYDAPEALEGVTAPSLGIGHAALHDGWIYAGFSRGGFRLLRWAPRQERAPLR